MAMLVKRKNSPFYYARFQFGGKDRWISTKCKDRKRAQQELKRLYAEARGELSINDKLKALLAALDLLPAEQQPSKRQEIARAILRAQEKKVALDDVWDRWKANPNKRYEPKAGTIAGYTAAWSRFRDWAKGRGLQYLHEISYGDAEAYAANLWASKVSPSTYNQHIKFLRSVCHILEIEAGLITNPFGRLQSKQKSTEGGRRNLSQEELQNVIGKAEGDLRLMFLIGLFTGLRLADVVNLKWENIENNPYPPDTGPRPGMIVIKPMKTSRLNKVIEVPLFPALAAELIKIRPGKAKGFLFPKQQAVHAKDPGLVTTEIQKFYEECDIKTLEEGEKKQRQRAIVRVGFHSLRHSFVSLCAKAGAPLHVVQKLVGHGNPMLTSDKYLHLDRQDMQAAVKSLPMIGFDEPTTEPDDEAKASAASSAADH